MKHFRLTILILMLCFITSGLLAIDVTVGDGTVTTLSVPINPYFGYSYSQQIFYQTELNVSNSQITAISFYWNGLGSGANSSQDWTIYLGHSTLTTFETTSSWIPVTELTQVYTGPVSITPQAGWITIQLATPFVYNNTQNLVLAVDENQAGFDTNTEKFLGTTTTGVNRSIRYYSDSTNLDPAAPPTGTLVAGMSNTMFSFTSLSPTPVFNVFPASKDFGQTLISSVKTQTFTVGNAGGGSYTLSNISISGDAAYTLQNMPTLPATLTSSTPVTFVVRYNPTAAGTQTATVTLTDNLARSVHTIPITGTCYDPSIATFPYLEDFSGTTFPPNEWSRLSGLLEPTSTVAATTSGWVQDDYCNVTAPVNKSARVNIYSTTYRYWLVTPPINLGNTTDYQMEFDLALTDYANSNPITSDPNGTSGVDDKFAVVISTDNGTTWSSANALRLWDNAGSPFIYNNIASAGEHVTLSLANYTGYVKVAFYGESTVSNADNDLFVDNLLIRPIPTAPLFAVMPTSKDFGQVHINTLSPAQTFTISNMGIGTLNINAIALAGADANSFVLTNNNTLPYTLESMQSITVTVALNATTVGNKSATLNITDNLGRVINSVPLTGSAYDATITTVPYSENFDLVTVPELPLGWMKLVNTTSTGNVVSYTGTSVNSAPNSISMANSGDANANLFLITPPIQNANSKRVKFYAKGGAGYTVAVGYLSNPNDPATFVQSEEIAINATFTEYMASLAALPAGVQRMAIKHGNGSTYRTLYIDDFMIENLPNQPEFAINTDSLGYGNVYQNSENNRTVVVTNNGLMPLTVNWTLPANITINPAGTTTLQAGATANIIVKFIPTTIGTYNQNIVLTTNDPLTPSHNISVTAEVLPPLPTGMYEIGNGVVVNQGLPIEPYYRYTYSQSIYSPEQLPTTTGQTIQQLGYQFNGNSVFSDSIKVFMGYTTQTSFANTTAWVASTNLTEVFNGPLTTTTNPGEWIMLDLAPHFNYTPGQSLVIAVLEYQGGNYHSSADEFYCTTMPNNRSMEYHSDTVIADPAAPPAGTLRSSIPNTRLYIAAPPTAPIFAVTPTMKDFGSIQINNPSPAQTFTIRNMGIGQLGITAMQITGADAAQFALTNPNTMPMSIGNLQSAQISVNFTPTSVGPKSATLVITDNLTRTPHNVPLNGTGYDATIVTFPTTESFDTSTPPALPQGWLSYVNATTTLAFVDNFNSTTNANSAPNTARLGNSSDAAATLLLITPPVQNTNTRRIRFFAKGGAGYTVEVGTITNPNDPATFTSLNTIPITAAHAEYIVSLAAVPAGNHRVAIKHGLGGTYRTIYVDDVTFQNLPTTAEIALSTTTIDYGTVYQFTPAIRPVVITNNGIQPLTVNWTLPASVTINPAGTTTVNPGQQSTVQITLMPQNQGNFAGTIQLATNDPASPNMSIQLTANVLPPLPAGMVEIGDGTVVSQNLPWEPFYRYTYSQSIYLATDLVASGGGPRITQVGYHFNGNSSFTDSIRVFIGYTNMTQFDSNTSWVPLDSLQLCFEGSVTTPAEDGWISIDLANPFFYTPGRNIVIGVHEPMAGPYHDSDDDFFCTLMPDNRSLIYYNDNTNPDPAAPPTGTLKTYIPNTRILFGSPQVPPRNLQATVGNSMVNLTWLAPQMRTSVMAVNRNSNASKNERTDRITLTNYKVYRNNAEIAMLPPTALSYTDTELVNGVTYSYYVTAMYVDPDGESGPSNIVQATPSGAILNPPVNLAGQSVGNDISLSWQMGSYSMQESFETPTLPTGWTLIDFDGDSNNWGINNTSGHVGGQCVSSISWSSATGVLNPFNWIVSAPITVSGNAMLYWWVCGGDPARLGDQYKVYISTTGNDISNFGAASLTDVTNSTTWARKQLSLSSYAGQTIWIAFVHQNSANHSMVKIDDVTIVAGSSREMTTDLKATAKNSNINRSLVGFKIYRNDQIIAQTEPTVLTWTDQNPVAGANTYYVTALYTEGESESSNVISLTDNTQIEIIPTVTALKKNYPNPFNPETTIHFDLAQDSKVEIVIFNSKGQKVKTLIHEFRKAGSHKVIWNGKDDNMHNCGSGIYFYNMKSGKYTSTGKMILMK